MSLREMGAVLEGYAPLGRLLREDPMLVGQHYKSEIQAGADVLLALTSDTMPRALAHVGMAFRAAALTRCAVELAIEAAHAADRKVVVAGVLGNRWIESMVAERIAEEWSMHAVRLAASGCELIVARGLARAASAPVNLARIARAAAVVSAGATRLPTWALLELDEAHETPDGEALEGCAAAAMEAGAQVLLLEVPRVEVALEALKRVVATCPGAKVGVLLGAGAGAEGGGERSSIEVWVSAAKSILSEGARVLGGGPGTTARYVAALSRALHEGH